MVYKPTYNWGAPSCMSLWQFPGRIYGTCMANLWNLEEVWFHEQVWLVVSQMFYVSISWEWHHPNWRSHIFLEGLKPPTRWQIYGTYVRKYGQILPKNMGSLWKMHQWKLVINVPPSLVTGGYMFFSAFLSKKFQGFKQHNIEISLAKHWDWSIEAEKLQIGSWQGRNACRC